MSASNAEKLAGRRVIASVSGGKDSAAMSLHFRELGIEHDRVFIDTGWEHAKTYEYLRGELTRGCMRWGLCETAPDTASGSSVDE